MREEVVPTDWLSSLCLWWWLVRFHHSRSYRNMFASDMLHHTVKFVGHTSPAPCRSNSSPEFGPMQHSVDVVLCIVHCAMTSQMLVLSSPHCTVVVVRWCTYD